LYYFEPEKPLRLAKFYGIGKTFDIATPTFRIRNDDPEKAKKKRKK